MKTRRPLLTKARAALNRKGYSGSTLAYPAPVMQRYSDKLMALTAQMTAQVQREVLRWAKTHGVAMDASPASQARILTNQLMARFTDLFARRAPELAGGMVAQADKASTSALHASLKQASGGMSLKTSQITPEMREFYTAATAENAALIESIASEYLGKVQQAVLRSITGNGAQPLTETLQDLQQSTQRRAQLLALDQTRKVYMQANAHRMKALGVKKFVWIHSGGGSHPRQQHQDWDGQIFDFDKLPVDDDFGPVLPGEAINCRCTSKPYIETLREDAE